VISRDPGKGLTDLVGQFTGHRLDFAEFHRRFIDRYTRLENRFLASEAGGEWHRVFERVCLAVPDPVPEEARRAGAIGAEELRAWLSEGGRR
jgi:hypothetical protein